MKAVTIIVQLLAQPLKALNEMIDLMNRSTDISETKEGVVIIGLFAYI